MVARVVRRFICHWRMPAICESTASSPLLGHNSQVQMVKDKLRDEERVLEVCRTKVLQRSLPMRVMDAEFQYDRHKLTFFFEAEG